LTAFLKRVLTTVWITLGALGTISAVILDIPQAFNLLINSGPAWLANPHVWPIIPIVAVTGLAIFVTWRVPSSADDPDVVMVKRALDVSPECGRLMTLLAEIRNFHRTVAEAILQDRLNPQYTFDQLEIVQPAKIRTTLGEQAAGRCVEIVQDTKRRARGDPAIVIEVAYDHISDEIWKAMFAEAERVRPRAAH
jgi:hypothetical protein